jgi:hypothetical protein
MSRRKKLRATDQISSLIRNARPLNPSLEAGDHRNILVREDIDGIERRGGREQKRRNRDQLTIVSIRPYSRVRIGTF